MDRGKNRWKDTLAVCLPSTLDTKMVDVHFISLPWQKTESWAQYLDKALTV